MARIGDGIDMKELIAAAWDNPTAHLPPPLGTKEYRLPDLTRCRWHAVTGELRLPGLTLHVADGARNNWIIAPFDADLRGNLSVSISRGCHNNVLILDGNSSRSGNIFFQNSGGLVVIGEETRQTSVFTMRLWSPDNLVFWGKESSSNGVTIIVQGNGRSVIVGEDCMFANDITIRSSDQHAIIDLNSNLVLNDPNSVHIEPHVWIAQGATIMKGVRVGFGCVIGAKSLVNRNVARFSLSAGIPAKVIRSEIGWSRYEQPESNLAEKLKERSSLLVQDI